MAISKRTWWRSAIVVCVLGFFIFLGNANVPLDGHTRFSYLIGEPSPFIGVWPGQGVSELKRDEYGSYRTLEKDSLYLDLRTTVPYRSVVMKITTKGVDSDALSEFGVRAGGTWSYRKVILHATDTKDGWTEYEATLDLSGADRQNGKYTLLIHLPADPGDEREVSMLSFDLSRSPLTPQSIMSAIMRHIE